MTHPPERHNWWPWYLLILFLILMALASGCVSQRVPNTEERASRKLNKHLTATKKITNVYPDLVDSVRSTLAIPVSLGPDTTNSFTPDIDSAAINKAFDEYDKKIAARDSLNKLLQSGLLNLEDSLKVLRNLEDAEEDVQSNRFTVVKEVFKDTTVQVTKSLPLYVGEDTLQLKLAITTVIKDGIPVTTLVVKQIDGTLEVEQTSPLFTIYNKIPWWVYLIAGLFLMLLLHKFFKIPR